MLWPLLSSWLLSFSNAFQPPPLLVVSQPAASLRRSANTAPPRDVLRPSITQKATVVLFAGSDDDNDDDGEHLQGIGVGIDLGTTNSAVAMMLPPSDWLSTSKNVPTMIEIDSRTTLPSVVALVPTSNNNNDDDDYDGKKLNLDSPLSLPPWTGGNNNDELLQIQKDVGIAWPTTSEYSIFTGNQAIEYEQYYPHSSYRNVKRVIGTGGKMASLAAGVVPNLLSSKQSSSSSSVDSTSDDITNFLLDDEFNMDQEKKENMKKKKGKWKRKKKQKNDSEIPKLHKQLEQAQLDPALLSCTLVQEQQHDDNGEEYSLTLRPEQISACILRTLFDAAEEHYCNLNNKNNNIEEKNGRIKVTRAVIGVPAYFTEAQRSATIRASELAGVDKVKLLPEPEAAALAYGNVNNNNDDEDDSNISSIPEDELILVFDLGGGTFDVSILEVGGGFTEVLATVGNNRLGGTDFDRRVAEYISGRAVEEWRKNGVIKSSSSRRRDDSLDDDDDDVENEGRSYNKRVVVKDWYRQGSGEVQDIILRVAEEARKSLTNQKVIEIFVPLTEEGWKKLGGGSDHDESSTKNDMKFNFIGPFDMDKLESMGWIDGQDYITTSLDRKTFEVICANELQMLLQPIREVAIMAGALLPGEARPSFVENALAMEQARSEWEDGEDFWEFDDNEDGLMIKMKGRYELDEEEEEGTEELLDEQALEQIQMMDLKAQKKAQQRGRRKARDIDKRERSFRKQKQSAMEDATTASLLGKQPQKKKNQGGMSSPTSSVSVGNEKVQEGIHGRVLSRIVLVGGATRMPVIAKLLEAVVGQTPQRTVNPDEAVALGCAVQAGILDGEDQGQTVLSPMAAAVMRALAKKRGMMVASDDGGGMMMDQQSSGISGMMFVDEFDDEDDFY